MTKSWKITDGQLSSYSEDSAVLTYVQSQTLRNGRTYSARVTDTFVKRDGRWLVKSEQQTLINRSQVLAACGDSFTGLVFSQKPDIVRSKTRTEYPTTTIKKLPLGKPPSPI